MDVKHRILWKLNKHMRQGPDGFNVPSVIVACHLQFQTPMSSRNFCMKHICAHMSNGVLQAAAWTFNCFASCLSSQLLEGVRFQSRRNEICCFCALCIHVLTCDTDTMCRSNSHSRKKFLMSHSIDNNLRHRDTEEIVGGLVGADIEMQLPLLRWPNN